jgi:uncharacterized phage protein (TIGR02218 family)
VRTLPVDFAAHLASGATTLAWCWRITRGDGVRLGFTDHDRPLTFDGSTFEAASGFSASELTAEVGLSVGNQELSGALRSDRLSEADLNAGLYDNASVEVFRVNWAAPAQRLLVRTGTIGEVKRGITAFTAEFRGLAHMLQQERGRIYQPGCDADLGDARCGVVLAGAALTGTGVVTALLDDRTFVVSGLSAYPDDWFTRGLLSWTSGANEPRTSEVKRHIAAAGSVRIEIRQDTSQPVLVGHSFTVSAGCDKQFGTCRTKFNNGLNFRGCPHMPGNDFVTSYPIVGEGTNTGGSLVS